ncbi:MAG: radical SAM protein [Theionarchaea archaeon]|nr:radical SAM protein [Theionarchaea archaeon]
MVVVVSISRGQFHIPRNTAGRNFLNFSPTLSSMEHRLYPALQEGYGIYVTPDGGYFFEYDVCSKAKKLISQRETVNVEACSILELCSGQNTVDDIVAILEKKYEDIPEDFPVQVRSFLDGLVSKGYIQYVTTPGVQSTIKGCTDFFVPTSILLEATHECNLHCEHCLLCAGQPLPDELSVEQYIPILKSLVEMGVRKINLSGGEFLLKEGWETLFHFCVSRCVTNVLTNATLVTDEIADMLTACDQVHVSLYGSAGATHDEVTGHKGSFYQTIRGITQLTERGSYVGASISIIPSNYSEFESMIQLCTSLGCSIARVGIVLPMGRARLKQWTLTGSQKRVIETSMEKLQCDIEVTWEEEQLEHGGTCGAGVSTWVIAPDGTVYPCGVLRIPLGNVMTDTVEEICRSPGVAFMHQLIAPCEEMCGDCPYLFICRGCHARAFMFCSQVDTCPWTEQFETAPHPFHEFIQDASKTS